MQYRFATNRKINILFFLGLSIFFLTIFFALPYNKSEAISNQKGLFQKTESHEIGLENYDIRLDKKNEAVETLFKFRNDSGKSASAIADSRADFVRGEENLRRSVLKLKVEYNADIKIPEVIAPDVKKGGDVLTSSSLLKRSEILRNFIKQNDSLFGVDESQINKLEVISDYKNPSGNMSFAHLEQRINGIPVFRGEIKAGFTADGEIVRIINNLAPELEYDSLSTDFGNPLDAVKAAATHINYKLQKTDVIVNNSASTDLKTVFGEGDWATTAEKMYFPTEVGVARPAWRVLIWQPVNAFYVIVDAETGTMLWRKNITEDQTQTATYQVYRNSNAYIDIAESPAPLTPGPTSPLDGTQGALLTRENVTLIGNEGDLSFNNLGWITDGGNATEGNNTIAGLDVVAPNGVDAPITGTSRTFSSAWNAPPGNPAPGDAPTVAAAQAGAVIQMFYTVNRYHDILYKLGFNEQSFNFQNDNFGRGGFGNDRVSSEGQDSSGTNNANFSTPADGTAGRMQMYRFTAPNPDRDGTTDVDIMIHELTHGTSNRLHGNAGGLGSQMSRGMGEGWSDWYAHVLTAQASDPINGIYTTGGYVLVSTTNIDNFYYGIRRFPKAVMAFTGGPNNRPHNPLTFADLNAGCVISDGAFAPSGGGACDQVHNAGEIWSSALWEVRVLMVQRLGFQVGTQRVLQVVTDGMKLAPLSPTFLQERDAILAAARANATSNTISADVADIWEGFRIRGMGFSASVQNSGTPAVVTEAFDAPNVVIPEPGFSISDSTGDNDGFPEPGETLQLNVPIFNNTGLTANNVSVNINGGTPINYGNIADGATVSNQFAFPIPAQTPCGSSITININISSNAGTRTEQRTFIIGQPNNIETENFDGVTAPALPSGWTTTQTGSGALYTTQTASSNSAPNSAFTPNTGLAGPQNGAILESINYSINAPAAVVSFKNKFDTEGGWDGGVLEISINGGAFQDIITAGGRFVEGGYNGTLGANSNPLDNRPAWSGNSNGYINSTVQLPASANGQSVKFRWRFGEDTNTSIVGWNVDDIKIVKDYSCSVTPTTNDARFDYDGDGKTDVSIFRPSVGEWWLLRSSNGSNTAFQFGSGTDKIVPADFTGDGKADMSFWRPATGEWFVLRSEDNSFFSFPFGLNGDIPAPGDFDGDNKADAAVFRPTTQTWFILRSSDAQVQITNFGIAEDKPVVEDYDGDGTDDIAIFRPSVAEWWILGSSTGITAVQFGSTDDKPTPADFTGDGKADVAFFRPSTGFWFILRSEDFSFFAFPFGSNGDIPVAGDYDGDGRADSAVFRPSNNVWFKNQTTNGVETVSFGIADDIPTPSAFVP